MKSSATRSRGFTLVELLVVMAIIATLAAILTPAVMMALVAARNGAIKLEVTNLERSIEEYKNQYGDYPPDFSEWPLVKRHYRKAFPQMSSAEWDTFETIALTNPGVTNDNAKRSKIDRSEALVFCLHGYSKDVTRPFTGPGGPLEEVVAGSVYGSRSAPALFEFDEARLTRVLNDTGSTPYYTSNDELNTSDQDPFPAYTQLYGEAPYVYFDSRTYVITTGNAATVNVFPNPADPALATAALLGTAQPYKWDQKEPRPKAAEVGAQTYSDGDANKLQFVNPSSFQIIAAGLDSKFSPLTVDTKLARIYPTGENLKTEDLDNVTNFSTSSTLNGDLP